MGKSPIKSKTQMLPEMDLYPLANLKSPLFFKYQIFQGRISNQIANLSQKMSMQIYFQ